MLNIWLKKIEAFHPSNIKLGLNRIQHIAQKLNLLNPTCPVITVAGTNGKGTCCTKLSKIYTEAGYTVGCYTSPHLIHFNERVMINHEPVLDQTLIEAFEAVELACKETKLTFFEFTTLSALVIFKNTKLDIMILEVGLGGRLDAVNVIDPTIAVITSIDLDHQTWLGNDRGAIALEKAGIMRASCPVFVSDPNPPLALAKHADAIGANLILTTEAALVSDIVEMLQSQRPVTQTILEHALKTHQLTGRLQTLSSHPTVILDVAHNPAATQRLANFIKHSPTKGKRIAIISLLKDKDILATLKPMLTYVDIWHTCSTEGARGAPAQHITEALTQLKAETIHSHDNVITAYAAAQNEAKSADQIIVFGSFQTVGGVLKLAS